MHAHVCTHSFHQSQSWYTYFLKTDSSLMSLHELVFTANVYVSACEGENWGLKNTHCYARLNVVSSVMMGVRRRLHGKLLLPNSNTSTHTRTCLVNTGRENFHCTSLNGNVYGRSHVLAHIIVAIPTQTLVYAAYMCSFSACLFCGVWGFVCVFLCAIHPQRAPVYSVILQNTGGRIPNGIMGRLKALLGSTHLLLSFSLSHPTQLSLV